jgi:hypothetical protein
MSAKGTASAVPMGVHNEYALQRLRYAFRGKKRTSAAEAALCAGEICHG